MSNLAEMKRAFAQRMLAAGAAKGDKNNVVVLPVFIDGENDGEVVATTEAITVGKNPEWGFIMLFQVTSTMGKGVIWDNERWTILRGKVSTLRQFNTPGTLLAGRIVSEDSLTPTNPGNLEQDLSYRSEALRIAKIPRTVGGQNIYNIKYWDPTGTVADTRIEHDNQEVMDKFMATSGKANSDAIRNAAPKVAKVK